MTPQRQLRQYKISWFLYRSLCFAWALVGVVCSLLTGPSVAWGCCLLMSVASHVMAVGARRGWALSERAIMRSQESLDNRYARLLP